MPTRPAGASCRTWNFGSVGERLAWPDLRSGCRDASVLTMPRLGNHFQTFEPEIRALGDADAIELSDVRSRTFELQRRGSLVIYYAPVDWLWPTARIAVVGITPSANTMLLAHRTAARCLADGGGPHTALQAVKLDALFSGFRACLVERLDTLGVAAHLGVPSAAALFERRHMRLLHATATVRYPTFKGNKNYDGQSPKLLADDGILRPYVYDVLAPELALIPDALVVPLGVRVDEALAALARDELLDPARCLVGFPHPSGANASSNKQWKLNRARLKRQVTEWFDQHPVESS